MSIPRKILLKDPSTNRIEIPSVRYVYLGEQAPFVVDRTIIVDLPLPQSSRSHHSGWSEQEGAGRPTDNRPTTPPPAPLPFSPLSSATSSPVPLFSSVSPGSLPSLSPSSSPSSSVLVTSFSSTFQTLANIAPVVDKDGLLVIEGAFSEPKEDTMANLNSLTDKELMKIFLQRNNMIRKVLSDDSAPKDQDSASLLKSQIVTESPSENQRLREKKGKAHPSSPFRLSGDVTPKKLTQKERMRTPEDPFDSKPASPFRRGSDVDYFSLELSE